MTEITFWQRIISPHMAGLATALGREGAEVSYFAETQMSADRSHQGWVTPSLQGVHFEIITHQTDVSEEVASFPESAVHLTQGIRRNGKVQKAIAALRSRGARWGTIMETIQDRGMRGLVKRSEYSWYLRRKASRPDFVLAIGRAAPQWLVERGYPAELVFPFAYFLEQSTGFVRMPTATDSWRVGFSGRMMAGKRLDLLIDALAELPGLQSKLVVVGGGPLEKELRARAESKLGASRVEWHGVLPIQSARAEIANCDCLVLPSDYDGWGAVISEALLSGVPVIASDACGASGVVERSGVGGVFARGDKEMLKLKLARTFERGAPIPKCREELRDWAQCLTCEAGARYLLEVVAAVYKDAGRPVAPWELPANGSAPDSKQHTNTAPVVA